MHGSGNSSLVLAEEDQLKLKKLAERISTLRWRAGLKVSELAALADVPHGVVTELEKGQLDIDLLALNEICCALAVSLPELLQLEVDSAEPLPFDSKFFPTNPSTLEESRRFLEWYRVKKQQYEWQKKARRKKLEELAHRRQQLRAARLQREYSLGSVTSPAS